MTNARAIRDQARTRAQRHHTALAALIHDAEIDVEMKDAMRIRLRGLWIDATIAMTIVSDKPATGEQT